MRNLFIYIILASVLIGLLSAQAARAGCDVYGSLKRLGIDLKVEEDFFKTQGKHVVAYTKDGRRQVFRNDSVYIDPKDKSVSLVMDIGGTKTAFSSNRFSKIEAFNSSAMPEGSIERELDQAIVSKAKVKVHKPDGTTVEGTVVGYRVGTDRTEAIIETAGTGTNKEVKHVALDDIEQLSGDVKWARGKAAPRTAGVDVKISSMDDATADSTLSAYTTHGDIVTITVKDGDKTRKITGIFNPHTGLDGEQYVVENGKFEFQEIEDLSKGKLGKSKSFETKSLVDVDRTHFVGKNKEVIGVGDVVTLADGKTGTVNRVSRVPSGIKVEVIDAEGETRIFNGAKAKELSTVKAAGRAVTEPGVATKVAKDVDYSSYVGKKVKFRYRISPDNPNTFITVEDAELMGVSNGKVHYRITKNGVKVDKYVAESQLERGSMKVTGEVPVTAGKPKAGAAPKGEGKAGKDEPIVTTATKDAAEPTVASQPSRAQTLLDEYKVELEVVNSKTRKYLNTMADEAKSLRAEADALRKTNPKLAAKFDAASKEAEDFLETDLKALRKACK